MENVNQKIQPNDGFKKPAPWLNLEYTKFGPGYIHLRRTRVSDGSIWWVAYIGKTKEEVDQIKGVFPEEEVTIEGVFKNANKKSNDLSIT